MQKGMLSFKGSKKISASLLKLFAWVLPQQCQEGGAMERKEGLQCEQILSNGNQRWECQSMCRAF